MPWSPFIVANTTKSTRQVIPQVLNAVMTNITSNCNLAASHCSPTSIYFERYTTLDHIEGYCQRVTN